MIPAIVALMVSVGEEVGSPGTGSLGESFGEAEIQHFHAALGSDFDVGGLEIAVHDALLVRVFQRFGDLARNGQSFLERHGPARDPFGEGGAFDQFENKRALFDTVDRRDVGMVQRGQHLRFAGEARQAVGIGGENVRQDFDGDVAIELGIGGAIDGAHAAFAEFGDDAVVGDGRARTHFLANSSHRTT